MLRRQSRGAEWKEEGDGFGEDRGICRGGKERILMDTRVNDR
jgi:hypothetical protein